MFDQNQLPSFAFDRDDGIYQNVYHIRVVDENHLSWFGMATNPAQAIAMYTSHYRPGRFCEASIVVTEYRNPKHDTQEKLCMPGFDLANLCVGTPRNKWPPTIFYAEGEGMVFTDLQDCA